MRSACTVMPGLVLLLALGPGVRAQDAPRRTPAQQVEAILAEVRRSSDVGAAAGQLARIGAQAVEPLLEKLSTGQESVPTRAAILAALAQMSPEQVLGFLASLARPLAPEPRRLAGLDLLARFGGSADLRLVFELGSPSEADAPPSPELQRALEAALAGILSREPGAARALADSFTRVPPAHQAAIVAVLAPRPGREALAALADLLGRASVETDALILYAIGTTARSQAPASDLAALERVRLYLAHPDARLVVLASTAAAALQDAGGVPDLIVLLEDGRANVRGAVHGSLQALTGVRLPAEADAWLAWLDEGLAWWNDRSDDCRAVIVSGDPQDAATAIHEVARQRLFVHEVAPLLALAARRPEPDLARSALRALSALPEPFARATLRALVAQADPELAEHARQALEGLQAGPRENRTLPRLPQLRSIP
ncbi:MAG TPA: hypothetical protein VF530_17480 [Planctomycetota bacterium]